MKLATRIALVFGAGQNLLLGFWACSAPRQFYTDFPGMGRVWVAIDGPYNEHLVRDVGAPALGLGLIAVAALVRDEAILLGVAGAANLVFGLPHAIYHLRHLDVYESSTDKVMSAGGLVLTTACAEFLLFAAYQRVNESPRRPERPRVR